MYSMEELALAYELKSEGCSWKRIAQGLGGDYQLLQQQIYHMEQNGFAAGSTSGERKSGRPFSVNPEKIRLAAEMRSHRLGWNCIARYLDVPVQAVRRSAQRCKQYKSKPSK